jgi:hypothetical protein
VLSHASPDYVDLPVNLYEPVAAAAVGLALIDRDPAGLLIGDSERRAIADRLRPLRDEERGQALVSAAIAGSELLGVTELDGRRYLCELIADMLPRIDVGLRYGTLDGVFVG